MALTLMTLPYDKSALEPHMSAKTFDFHYGKHHQTYVDRTNAAIEGTPLAGKSLVEIVRAAKDSGNQGLFNNSAQVWNHDFLWQSMKPNGGGAPTGELADKINAAFGSLEGFAEAFKKEATAHFGSGWAWLVAKGDTLAIISTHDADTPLVHDGVTPLLTLDVWEHAYYLDYQNARPNFVDAFLKSLINWDFAAANYAARG